MTALPIVAGVDGSERSSDAALWAAEEAVRRRSPLHLVITNDDPARAAYADQAVQDAGARCRAHSPGLDVSATVAVAHPVDELLSRASSAQMIVVGSRGRGPVADVLLGSVSAAVATNSVGPVVVVRAQGSPSGPVLVGVDGSPSSTAALRFAFEAAHLRNAELVAMQVWHGAAQDYPIDESGVREPVQELVEQRLQEQVAELSARFPDVRTREVVRRGHPVSLLKQAARDAQLLVVGHRGRGGFDGLLLGSVATGVLHHAPGPVAVVRGDRDRPDAPTS